MSPEPQPGKGRRLDKGGVPPEEFQDAHFNYFRLLAMTQAGITLPDYKRNMVQRRIGRRLTALGLTSFDHYILRLKGPEAQDELREFVNALTTNKTEFFREAHHFALLRQLTLKPFQERLKETGKPRLRIWSAGCSSGQEPYSIAMTVADAIPDFAAHDIRILATDIDTEMVATARAGLYPLSEIELIPEALRARFIERAGAHGQARIASGLRSMLRFNPLNLHGPWPMQGKFDAIFCRNVIIYFDKAAQAALFERFASQMTENGTLFIGHSESLFRVSDRFESIGQSTYRKVR